MQSINDIRVIRKEDCTGCDACLCACPVHAIRNKADEEGFLYPDIEEEKCVHCGLCINACPVWSMPPLNIEKYAYAAYAKDKDEHCTSSSGGIYAVFARYVLENDGYICGAAFDESLTLKHLLSNQEKDLEIIKGTKYVQSEVGSVFSQIEKVVKEEKQVLFCGTPCQVGGLKSYLKRDYDNLLTIDLICHGVPSPMVLKMYLSELQKDNTVVGMSFRNKTEGISNVYLDYYLMNGEVIQEKYEDSEFIKGFIQNLTIRPSCFNCEFKGQDRCSDITIGDFWGLNDYHPEMITNMGTSAVLIHTKKGKWFFNQIQPNINCVESKPEYVAFWNTCLEQSVEKNPRRDEFFKRINMMSIKDNINDLYIVPTNIKKNSLAKKILRKIKGVINNGNG